MLECVHENGSIHSSNSNVKCGNNHKDAHNDIQSDQSSNRNNPTSPTNTQLPADEPDPLELKKLSLSYDYLTYKIKDHIKTLTDQTYAAVLEKQELINKDYIEGQLDLSQKYEQISQLIQTCNDLELDFMKIDQLEIFVEDFAKRLDVLEAQFSDLSTHQAR
ncbi:hypothetical protein LELG_01527 [Lodderomyces elongisporus NRRL YB-4239]|uniref:Biogenesis of lysosome-related organelles complex 1 subunit CNL1 n=1 Tax=Lodderomyces elongisporus (strain ATCC 11503 / CBS 2605 / JCM 1781 / NBRC 1676 / NRRL YB-4239) TaxID=379508 RepID=A5DVZ1_LODEL|nr:hypothetical protein LELG_01527 [Lodderomyces elongisporus NRRL YB-4239]